jgi:hypothetical protein
MQVELWALLANVKFRQSNLLFLHLQVASIRMAAKQGQNPEHGKNRDQTADGLILSLLDYKCHKISDIGVQKWSRSSEARSIISSSLLSS